MSTATAPADTMPGTDSLPGLPTPDPVTSIGGVLEVPADTETETAPGKRPTTRAGRAAAREAKAKAAQLGSSSSSSTPRPDKAPTGRPRTSAAEVRQSVGMLHEMAGAAVSLSGLPLTGSALSGSSKEAGDVWADLVKRYPQLEKLFGGATDGLIYFRLFAVYAPIVQVAMVERGTMSAAQAEMVATMTGTTMPETPGWVAPDTGPPA